MEHLIFGFAFHWPAPPIKPKNPGMHNKYHFDLANFTLNTCPSLGIHVHDLVTNVEP